MSDLTAADDIAAALQDAAATIAGNLHAGRYELLRTVEVSDGQGGFTEAETVVETGRCALEQMNVQGADRQRWSIEQAIGSYVAELPITSIVQATDQVRITVANRGNEARTFDITGQPLKGDDMAMFVTVNLELAR